MDNFALNTLIIIIIVMIKMRVKNNPQKMEWKRKLFNIKVTTTNSPHRVSCIYCMDGSMESVRYPTAKHLVAGHEKNDG